jgi:glycerophosphoryl diester phosphodiesterase
MVRTANMAHRGGAALWPENTMRAFEGALDLGCDAIELDCHLTAAGELVVVHDYTESTNVAEVPRLRGVVRLAKERSGAADLWIELKTAPMCPLSGSPVATADAVARVLRKEDFVARAVVVGFDWIGPAHAKRVLPALRVACTTPPLVDPEAILPLLHATGADAWFAHVSSLTPEAVALARKLGLGVAVWTVNEETDLMRALDLGCDAICTDFPDRLAACLKARRI